MADDDKGVATADTLSTGEGGAQSAHPWVPAFPGQRPPFTPGHTLSMQHGAWSERVVAPIAAELVALVRADPAVTWLTAADGPALEAWARAETQVQLFTAYLAKAAKESEDGVGDLDADRVKTAYRELHRAEARATTGRTRLGLDPLSRARLSRDTAATNVDMARLMAELERQAKDGAGPTRVPPATRGDEA